MAQLEISSANVVERYGVGKSTVLDTKKNCDKILHSKQEMRDMGMSKKAKVMKVGRWWTAQQGRVLVVQVKAYGRRT